MIPRPDLGDPSEDQVEGNGCGRLRGRGQSYGPTGPSGRSPPVRTGPSGSLFVFFLLGLVYSLFP